jgi:hypothetical protein
MVSLVVDLRSDLLHFRLPGSHRYRERRRKAFVKFVLTSWACATAELDSVWRVLVTQAPPQKVIDAQSLIP